MTIPIIIGISAARDKILQNRGVLDRPVPPALAAKLHKIFGEGVTPDQAVGRIVEDVKSRGDAALLEWTRRLDGVTLSGVVVSPDEIETAYAETPRPIREALEFAAARIRAFHEKCRPTTWLTGGQDAFARARSRFADEMKFIPDDNPPAGEAGDSSLLGQRITPLARVGIYVPGGTAPLPSSLLMAAIPAQVAGVREIVVATPPAVEGTGAPDDRPRRARAPMATLAAAKIAGVSRVYAMGGAQSIAALAFGTETVGRVDKIVGAGGLFTTLAKRRVFGAVGIDGLYGPTETLLIADDSANPAWCAADLLAQAEHDVLATSILITTFRSLADAVAREIDRQLATLERRDIIAQSLAGQGAIVVVDDLGQAMDLANAFGPEHMCLLVREPWAWVDKVQNAGGVFVGEWTNEALGDYVIGPSHVMPTAGTARFSCPLNVNDFVKITSVFSVSADEARSMGKEAATLAQAEGLTAHANAIQRRMTNEQTTNDK